MITSQYDKSEANIIQMPLNSVNKFARLRLYLHYITIHQYIKYKYNLVH